MSINARIRKSKRQSGASYGFEILENFRDKGKMGKPNNRTVARIGTVKDYNLGVPIFQERFWKKVDSTLDKLIKRREISVDDKSKIERRFAEFISRPAPAAIVPTKPKGKPKVTFESLQDKYPMLSKLGIKSR